MGVSEIKIVKRDGSKEPFSIEKIKYAVSKAFLSVGSYATDDDLAGVLSRVHVSDGMSVEEIQNQVEVRLWRNDIIPLLKVICYIARNTWKTAKTARN